VLWSLELWLAKSSTSTLAPLLGLCSNACPRRGRQLAAWSMAPSKLVLYEGSCASMVSQGKGRAFVSEIRLEGG
jgi:hypothetical protein